MEQKPTLVRPVERLGKISPIVPIRFFHPFPDQTEKRKRERLRKPAVGKGNEEAMECKDGSIDFKV